MQPPLWDHRSKTFATRYFSPISWSHSPESNFRVWKRKKSSHLHRLQICLSGATCTYCYLERKRSLEHWGSPIKYCDQILRLLEAVRLPTEVSIYHCKGHQKWSTEVARGNQAADQEAKRAALQNHDLTGVTTLVPQTNLPETTSYTEGETLKPKSEGFQDPMGWFQKEGFLFLPGDLQWKLVNSF